MGALLVFVLPFDLVRFKEENQYIISLLNYGCYYGDVFLFHCAELTIDLLLDHNIWGMWVSCTQNIAYDALARRAYFMGFYIQVDPPIYYIRACMVSTLEYLYRTLCPCLVA